jgi:hypothetical protein
VCQVEQYKAPGQELWSLAVGGGGGGGGAGHLVAAGGDPIVQLWDRRTRKGVATFEDLHTEAVTQVTHDQSAFDT